MSALEFWTQTAIWILIAGSFAVFIWFVRDLLRLGASFAGPGGGLTGGASPEVEPGSRDARASPSRRRGAPPDTGPSDDPRAGGGHAGTESPPP